MNHWSLEAEKNDWWYRAVLRRPALRGDTPLIQPTRCPVCTTCLDYSHRADTHRQAQLNRIVAGGYYEYGNVEVICRTCNRRLQDSTTEHLIQLLQHKLKGEHRANQQHQESPEAPPHTRVHQPG